MKLHSNFHNFALFHYYKHTHPYLRTGLPMEWAALLCQSGLDKTEVMENSESVLQVLEFHSTYMRQEEEREGGGEGGGRKKSFNHGKSRASIPTFTDPSFPPSSSSSSPLSPSSSAPNTQVHPSSPHSARNATQTPSSSQKASIPPPLCPPSSSSSSSSSMANGQVSRSEAEKL